jgi:hypothetical protein
MKRLPILLTITTGLALASVLGLNATLESQTNWLQRWLKQKVQREEGAINSHGSRHVGRCMIRRNCSGPGACVTRPAGRHPQKIPVGSVSMWASSGAGVAAGGTPSSRCQRVRRTSEHLISRDAALRVAPVPG